MEAKATEVKNVQTHTYSYGKEFSGVQGKLILIHQRKFYPEIDQLGYYQDNGSYFLNRISPTQRINSNSENVHVVNPVIISDNEIIEIGDRYLNAETKDIYTCNEENKFDINNDSHIFKKILALPKNLSHKHLQAIVDGKIKDGDTVLLECQELIPLTIKGDGLIKEVTEEPKGYFIKLNDKNQITIHPAVKEKNNKINLSKEELLDFCERYHRIREIQSNEQSDTWFEKNISKFLFILLPILLFFSVQTSFAGNSNKTIDSLIKRSETAPNAAEKANL